MYHREMFLVFCDVDDFWYILVHSFVWMPMFGLSLEFFHLVSLGCPFTKQNVFVEYIGKSLLTKTILFYIGCLAIRFHDLIIRDCAKFIL